MNQEIRELLDNGVTMVTPTLRLARSVGQAYNSARLARGDRSWPAADIIDWDNWCRRLREEILPDTSDRPVVLNQYQEQALWLRVVSASPAAEHLMHVAATARQARESCRECRSWRIPIFPDDVYLNDDASQFQHWVTAYEQEIRKNHWIDKSGLADWITDQLESGVGGITGNVAFYGFDELLPQQLSLINILKERTDNVYEIGVSPCNKRCTVHVAKDLEDEIARAARWAGACLRQYPDSRIGVVFPQLPRIRPRVETIFSRHLHIAGLLDDPASSPPFAISQGRALADYPLVGTAMHVLALALADVTLNQAGVVLKSPCIGGYENERGPRARLEVNLRSTGEGQFTLRQLLRWMKEPFSEHGCPVLAKNLQALAGSTARLPARLLPGEWVIRFSELLECMGWPGERASDSTGWQTLEAWKSALDHMRSLDLIAKPVDARAALTRLRGILTDTSFQPETGEAPVQVMGTRAAAAMAFDYLWVAGLDDQSWPPPVAPVPFIPLTLQRQSGIPAATANTRLQEAGRVLDTLVQSTPEVVLSHALVDRDRELRPSPLLQRYATETDFELQNRPQSDFYEDLTGAGEFEYFEDPCGPAVAPDRPATGGSSIFKDQSLCPFRAFARHRLHAQTIDTIDIGLDARERGQLAHRVLQRVWDRLKTLKQLKTVSVPVLEDMIHNAVAETIRHQARFRPETFAGRFRQLEQRRLEKLVHDWLQVDLERSPFTVIATEKGHHVRFAGITLNMRLDRIDELPDGRRVIIDYKTGHVSTNDWEGERPSDPQLPLYAVTSEGEIAALAYASLKTGAMHYAGQAVDEALLPGNRISVESDWEDKLRAWEITLNTLGEEFLTGEAGVVPKDDQACRTCDLHSLCRIHEKVRTRGNEVNE